MRNRRVGRRRTYLSRLLRKGLVLSAPIALMATVVLAVVTITGFVVEAGDNEIFVNWETASEIGNLGFYVSRSESETAGYTKLPLGTPSEQFIPSQDDFGIGALYEYVDTQVTPGVLYYYKVEDVPSSGGSETVGPLSAMIPLPGTNTPTMEPPTVTLTPTPDVDFWADPTQVAAGSCSTVFWQTQNVRAVYFDGAGVSGEGAQAFCPCVDEMHVLRVQYRDGRSEDFPVTIRVTGTCGSTTRVSPLATPPVRSTPTPPPAAPLVCSRNRQQGATAHGYATPYIHADGSTAAGLADWDSLGIDCPTERG